MSHSPLILVVGMHRSGTSLLGSLLPQLGVPMPGELIAGDDHNPEGYYERADITELQENLLIGLRRWWPSAAGADALLPGWLDAVITRSAAAQLRTLLAADQQQRFYKQITQAQWTLHGNLDALDLNKAREIREQW